MRPLRAVALPAVRAQLAEQMRREVRVYAEAAAAGLVPADAGAGDAGHIARVGAMWQRQADAMNGASLWWVTPDMTTLAADTALSGDDLPPWHPGPEARAGLLVWDGGLPVRVINRTRHRPDVEVSIDAVSWAPIPDGSQHPDLGGMRIEVWTRAGRAIVSTPMPLELITIRIGDGHDPRVPRPERACLGLATLNTRAGQTTGPAGRFVVKCLPFPAEVRENHLSGKR